MSESFPAFRIFISAVEDTPLIVPLMRLKKRKYNPYYLIILSFLDRDGLMKKRKTRIIGWLIIGFSSAVGICILFIITMKAREFNVLLVFTPEKGITIKENGVPIKARYLSDRYSGWAILTRLDNTKRHIYLIVHSDDGPDAVGNDGCVYDCPEWKGPYWPILIKTRYSTPPPCRMDQEWSLDIIKNGDHKFITNDGDEIIISKAP
jgi:hypothetical protein